MDPHRRDGEEALAAHWRVPAAAIAEVLDGAFGTWTRSALADWIELEIGALPVLEDFAPLGGVRRRAHGPRLLAVIAARGVPTTIVGDLLAGLLLKAPVWVKPASGADDLAARFADTVADCDPGLGAAIEVSSWRTGSETETAVLAAADTIVATGGTETIAAMRGEIAPDQRVILHGPRLSAAILTKEALAGAGDETIAALARDTAFAGQMGCLSPVVAYVEAAPRDVADLLGPVQAACAGRWPCPPRLEAPPAERAAYAEWQALAGVEAAAGVGGPWVGETGDAWSVQVRGAAPPAPPAIPRLLILAPVERAETAAALCAERRGTIACVGIEGPPRRIAELARTLGAAGVERVTRLGRMQNPPVAWRRDGRPTLADLVRWVDWET